MFRDFSGPTLKIDCCLSFIFLNIVSGLYHLRVNKSALQSIAVSFVSWCSTAERGSMSEFTLLVFADLDHRGFFCIVWYF